MINILKKAISASRHVFETVNGLAVESESLNYVRVRKSR